MPINNELFNSLPEKKLAMNTFTKAIYTFLLSLLLHSLAGINAFAESKIALIIGNSSYKVGPLKNPVNDAKLMGETLKKIGFKLVGGGPQLDLTREQLSMRILEFGDQLRSTKGVGIFYFAGHGVQLKGQNYLIPIGAKLEREEHIGIYGVPVDHVLEQMEDADNKLNLMILDACRNNPFVSSTRSLTRGVKLNAAPSGTLILYATRPGMVSLDGDSSNSPFTRALTANMQRQGLKIEEVMRSTIKQVEQETNLRQTPWQEGFVREEFYFVEPDHNATACPAGSKLKQGQCVAQVKCPLGTTFEVGKGCIAQMLTQVSSNIVGNTKLQVNKTKSSFEAPSLVKFVPTWSYAALGLGLISHITNFTTSMSNPNLVNLTFGTAILGYTLTGVGFGYALYQRLDWVPNNQTNSYAFLPVITSDSALASMAFTF